jgi:hypothetical protein
VVSWIIFSASKGPIHETTRRVLLPGKTEAGLRSPLRNPASFNDRPETTELKLFLNSNIVERKSRPDRALPFTTRPQPTVVAKRRPILKLALSVLISSRPLFKVIIKNLLAAISAVGNGNECATKDLMNRKTELAQGFFRSQGRIVLARIIVEYELDKSVYDMVVRRAEME